MGKYSQQQCSPQSQLNKSFFFAFEACLFNFKGNIILLLQMLPVLKVDFLDSQDAQQLIPCKIFQISCFLDGCVLRFPHLGKVVQHLQVYLSLGVCLSKSFQIVQKNFKSSKHVIHKLSILHVEAFIMSCQSRGLLQFDIFSAFIVYA